MNKSEVFLDISAELLSQGIGVRFRPKGASMHPAIKDGETVTIIPIGAGDIRRGDIIMYKAREVASAVIAHRVVKVNKSKGDVTSFIMRGDASQSDDAPVAPGQVLGKVVSVEREGRDVELESRRAGALRIARFLALIVEFAYGNQRRLYEKVNILFGRFLHTGDERKSGRANHR